MQYHQSVVQGKGKLPDELLYGRVGYLYSLIYINQQFQQETIPIQYIQQVTFTSLYTKYSVSPQNILQGQCKECFELLFDLLVIGLCVFITDL